MHKKNPTRFLILVVSGVVAALAFCDEPTPGAADWPQFRGARRDGCSTETGLMKSWPQTGLEPLWVAAELGKGYSSAAVADGLVYVTGMLGEGNEGFLFCFDLAGKPQWRQSYGPEYTGTYPGTRATPTLDAGRIFLMSGTGRVVCFDVKTGAVAWSREAATEFGGEAPRMGFNESLLVDRNNVICTPGGPDASVVALDRATGGTVWTSKGLSDQSAYCSPLLVERGGTRLIITLTAKTLVGIEVETGALLWRRPFDAEEVEQNHSITPVYHDGCLYVTSGHRKGGQMFELSPDGKQTTLKWSDEILNTSHGGVLLVDGYLYGTTSKGDWVCLALQDGAVKYEAPGIGSGAATYADGMLYCYGEKGTLGLAKASPAGYELVSSFKITQGTAQHWPHPSIAGGRLYIRHGDCLIVYDVRAK